MYKPAELLINTIHKIQGDKIITIYNAEKDMDYKFEIYEDGHIGDYPADNQLFLSHVINTMIDEGILYIHQVTNMKVYGNIILRLYGTFLGNGVWIPMEKELMMQTYSENRKKETPYVIFSNLDEFIKEII